MSTACDKSSALADCERAFFRGEQKALGGYLDCARAVRRIIDETLWEGAADSFADYCAERLKTSMSNAFTLRYCAEVWDELVDAECDPLPTSITQLRALVSARANGIEVQKVWCEAVKQAAHRRIRRGVPGGPLIEGLVAKRKKRRKRRAESVEIKRAIESLREALCRELKDDGSVLDGLCWEMIESLNDWERRLNEVR